MPPTNRIGHTKCKKAKEAPIAKTTHGNNEKLFGSSIIKNEKPQQRLAPATDKNNMQIGAHIISNVFRSLPTTSYQLAKRYPK
jgi:hypothetical protein